MKEKVTIEKLAQMVARGFEDTGSKISELKTDIHELKIDVNELKADNKQLRAAQDHSDARLGRIEADIHEMSGNVVYKYEFEDLEARVKYLEVKAGVESGK